MFFLKNFISYPENRKEHKPHIFKLETSNFLNISLGIVFFLLQFVHQIPYNIQC